MKSKRRTSPVQRRWLAGCAAALFAAVAGLALLTSRFGDGLTRFSYDFPFFVRAKLLRAALPSDEVRMVYLDDLSHKELSQPMNAPWDRSLHAQLIDRLTAEGAKLIVFDIIFTDPSASVDADRQMADAMRKSGRVVLAGAYHPRDSHTSQAWEEFPYEPFRSNAAGWGNPDFIPDADDEIRGFFPNVENVSGTNVSWLPWKVAQLAGQKSLPDDLADLWFNFAGPEGPLKGLSFSTVLKGAFPPGFFRDKIVFVGQHVTAGYSGTLKDDFRTPYSDWGMEPMPGVDFHATATLNFLHHNWLVHLPRPIETIAAIVIAIAAGLGLTRRQPLWSTGVALAGMLAVTLAALLLVWEAHIWFAWLIVVIEIAAALLFSIVENSLQLYIDKRVLHESLSVHLSPAIVKQVVEDPGLRKLGGDKHEISIVFTDIANFSRVSEMMDPNDLVDMLNRYFDSALGCIHENDGTIMDLIGDAIFAIWNAPTKQPDHRERACRAALELHRRLKDFEAANLHLPLRTRVGLHTGTAVVGNIGSSTRFDYTAIGEAINLASRLEGLNKHLGTDVLATREIQRAVEDEMTTRLVGHFKFKGFGRAVEVHELVGQRWQAEPSRAWRDKFAAALQEFRHHNFDSAAAKFEEVSKLRRLAEADPAPGTSHFKADGPSGFYLQKIEEFRNKPPPGEWLGEIDLTEK